MSSNWPTVSEVKTQAKRVHDAEQFPSIDKAAELAMLLDMIARLEG